MDRIAVSLTLSPQAATISLQEFTAAEYFVQRTQEPAERPSIPD
jgi:hypothetical protein